MFILFPRQSDKDEHYSTVQPFKAFNFFVLRLSAIYFLQDY